MWCWLFNNFKTRENYNINSSSLFWEEKSFWCTKIDIWRICNVFYTLCKGIAPDRVSITTFAVERHLLILECNLILNLFILSQLCNLFVWHCQFVTV